MEKALADIDITEYIWWAIIVSGLALTILLVIRICVKIYFLKINEQAEDKTSMKSYDYDGFMYSVMEILVSNTCILGVLFVYYLVVPYMNDSGDYNGIFLLVLIIISTCINEVVDKTFLDMLFVHNGNYPKNYLRMASSLIILAFFIFFSFWYSTNQYISVIVLLMGLILGRFIYFDSSIKTIWADLHMLIQCWKSIVVAIMIFFIIVVTGIGRNLIIADNLIPTLFFSKLLFFMAFRTWFKIIRGY